MLINFPKNEERILKFWKDNKIFEKSIEQRKKAPDFVFYEGPPTANAKPGIHHVLSRVYKDIICRYKAMKGFRVERKAGWDTHGLPVELEIEKKLGLKNKKDIEEFGIAKFNKLCKESIWNYKKDWEKLTERIAFWLDMENPYITYTPDYIETVWWIIKQTYQKGLIYKDYKVVPYCPRCGTSLSSHEVAQGYKSVKENSVYVKFPIKGEKDTYFLVWTTTPWTLPGNVAIAVNPSFVYVKARVDKEIMILAKERLNILSQDYETIEEVKGRDLLKVEYEPLFKSTQPDKKAWFVIPGNFVSLDEGTGLVHIAPAFGEEDMEIGKENNLPVVLNVDEEGKFKSEVKPWAGIFVKDADPLIIEDLKARGLLFKEEFYEHDYPFCWRCHSPLLYYAKESWFINMQRVKKDLIKNNQMINWVPAHLKEGRFGEWLRDIKDWAFSRERYWGTPLPIWQCKKCGNLEVIGSLEDLLSQRFSKNNFYFFRHGHSLRQVKKIAMCWPEKIRCPLTKKGEKEVRASAKKLGNIKIDIIFSSDLLRARQTAQIIAQETGAKIIFDKRLREYNVGIFNGKNPQIVWDYLKKNGNIILAKPPKGESIAEIKKRAYQFLKEINKKYQGKNIVVVSHELPFSILEGTLKGWQLSKILEWRRQVNDASIQTGNWRKVEFGDFPHNEKMELDFHRPYIDEVKFYCKKCPSSRAELTTGLPRSELRSTSGCKNLMERTPEVMDCWFDSGAMPFAQAHWPLAPASAKVSAGRQNQKLKPPELFPADFISEAIDQTRGWFYTLLAISTLLGFGTPYKNVISLGHVLDEKGEKMSKSKGNVVDPWYIIDKYGADAIRWYFYTINQPGSPKLFSEKDVEGSLKKFVLILWNSFLFFETYSKKSKFQIPKSRNIFDRWIISKLNSLIQIVSENLDKYDVTGAARAIENFTVEDLSQWYIRRSRRRFHLAAEQSSLRGKTTTHPPHPPTFGGPLTRKDFDEASQTLRFVLLTLSKLTAPFIPFLSEEIHQGLGNKYSVHLENWPNVDEKAINKILEEEMAERRKIISEALAKRAELGIKIRQPLAEVKLRKPVSYKVIGIHDTISIVADEINVEKVSFQENLEEPQYDTKITPELREKGILREIIRSIQDMRKKAGLKPSDEILVVYSTGPRLNQILKKEKKLLLKEARVKDLIATDKFKKPFDVKKEVVVDKEKLLLAIKKVR